MSLEPLPNLDRSSLRERALHALRTAVTSGAYRPGDHLGEVDLSTQLGISRGTVREALRHLEQEGLLVAAERGMLRVRQLTAREATELFRVRGALEGLACAELIARADRDAVVARLREALVRLDDAGEVFQERLLADLGFHQLLCQLSGNSMLLDSWLHLEGPMRVTILSLPPQEWRSMTASAVHAPIVDAVEAGDADAASRIVTEHMRAAAARYAAIAA